MNDPSVSNNNNVDLHTGSHGRKRVGMQTQEKLTKSLQEQLKVQRVHVAWYAMRELLKTSCLTMMSHMWCWMCLLTEQHFEQEALVFKRA